MKKTEKYVYGQPHFMIIKLLPYKFDLMVSWNEEDEVLLKRLIKYHSTKKECKPIMNLPDTTNARYYLLPSNQSVIRIKTVPNKYEQMGIIAHEVFHCVTSVLEELGMKLELYKSDEAYAYLLGYLCEEIFKEMRI